MNRFFLIVLVIFCIGCESDRDKSPTEIINPQFSIDTVQGNSLLGNSLISPQLDKKADSSKIANYNEALHKFELDSTDVDNFVWLGRRMAYLGDYKKAIEIYSNGIEQFPNNPRLYRHRGHRYISIRDFDNAIQDLDKAAELIQGKEDVIEQDGIPNRLNTPVSSLHTNIYYHLGLAHYLKGDLEQAETDFLKCLEASQNDDMQVAALHWIYMILREQGKDNDANDILEPISADMNIIENDAYHQLLLFYKGLKSEDELVGNNSSGSSEAVKYGIANWYFYNDQTEKALIMFEELVNTGNWAGFGFIAAEAKLSKN